MSADSWLHIFSELQDTKCSRYMSPVPHKLYNGKFLDAMMPRWRFSVALIHNMELSRLRIQTSVSIVQYIIKFMPGLILILVNMYPAYRETISSLVCKPEKYYTTSVSTKKERKFKFCYPLKSKICVN